MKEIFVGILASAFWLAASTAWAASAAPPTVAEELLEIVRAAGIIDDAKYEELRERAKREADQRVEAAVEQAEIDRQAHASVPAPAAEPEPTDWSIGWSNGFKVARNDGAFKLDFGGRIQNDWALIDLDNELDDHIGGEGNGTEFRRARLFFAGTVYERLNFRAQFDFANTGSGTVNVNDLYMALKDLGPVGTVRVGHTKESFSMESLGSSKYKVFMERGLPSVFYPARNTGFRANNNAFDKKLVWGLGIFRDTNDSGFSFSDNSDWNVTGRIAGAPVYEDNGAKVVHVGASYSHQFRGGDFMLRYRQRPESHLARRFLDTGDLPVNDIDLLGLEFATVLGPASLQGEYVRSWVNGRNTKDTDFWSTYVQASYFLTGEHRNYQLGDGFFGRVKPSKNFNPKRGHWGAWEVGARFSYLDLDDRFAEGGKMWDVTAALNWYLYPNARVMLNYIHSRVDDRTVIGNPTQRGVDGDADIVQARFQVDF
jgi:phosphate-selective porin OprO/OprP